jgi:predicted  nucleic acid-binding Zn-ribbon protein
MAQNDFIEQFDASMRRLNDVRQGIQANLEAKQQFTNNIKDSLTQISRRLAALVGEITTLKNRAEELEGNVNRNTASINDKDRQYQELQAQIAQLQEQHEADIRALNEEKQRLTQQANEQQGKIDECEKNLREITELQKQLTAERDALRNELNGKGDQSAEHAQQIQQLTEQAQQREQELTNRINQCEARIAEFERQINEKDAEIARVNQEHQNTQGNAENQSQNLQQQIDQLTQQNQQLTQKIVAATQAIMGATEDLERLTAAVPNATTQQEVNAILEEIEQSLQNISNVIQGQRAAAAAPVASTQVAPKINPATQISLLDFATGQPTNVSFEQIMNQVSQKSKISGRQGQKYRDALNQLNNERDSANVATILRNNNVGFKNGAIFGGRKTKKNRKQKGGFIYKTTYTRRSTTSSPKSVRRTKRSR